MLDSPEAVQGGVDKLPRPRDSKYGGYYFPWIQVYDPERGNVTFPPGPRPGRLRAPTTSAVCTRPRPTRSFAAPSACVTRSRVVSRTS